MTVPVVWPPLPAADRIRFAMWLGGVALLGGFIGGLGGWALLLGGAVAMAAYLASQFL